MIFIMFAAMVLQATSLSAEEIATQRMVAAQFPNPSEVRFGLVEVRADGVQESICGVVMLGPKGTGSDGIRFISKGDDVRIYTGPITPAEFRRRPGALDMQDVWAMDCFSETKSVRSLNW